MNMNHVYTAKPKIALVIGAGGVKCAAALGIYKALKQFNFDVDTFVGCSGGSIYAALLAMGHNAKTAEDIVTALWTRDVTQVPNRSGYLMTLMPKNSDFKQKFSFRKDSIIMERLNSAFGEATIDELQSSLAINATTLSNGQSKVFTQERIVDAIRASIAIPSVFQPWEINGELYSDGILSNPLPIDVAAKLGADIIIAVGFPMPMRKRIHNISRFNLHINSILTNNLLQSKIELCKQAYDSEVLIVEPVFQERYGIFDAEKIPAIIKAGEVSMLKRMTELDSLILRQSKTLYPIIFNNGRSYQSIHAL